MDTATMTDKLIEAAQADAVMLRTITRVDGTQYQGAKNYGIAIDGAFQVYVVPVEQRTTVRKPHYRATFYLLVDGHWKRASRASFEAKLAEVVRPCEFCGFSFPDALGRYGCPNCEGQVTGLVS